ncbi:hypothetical protein MNB_SUP05-SYMBIONT-4-483 [hydrothermal vent metagenome]|uniref:Pentapeptide repeat family protein n=1 Tax=hydrothermal vent metagenome TaxID=652676 RepID=A0A1W1E0F2_9ZZZZ
MSRIIPTSVEIFIKDDKEYLSFSNGVGYEISEQKTIRTNETIYYLIEKESQIDERIITGDFKCCIFLMGVCFENKEFKEPTNFDFTIFAQGVNFYSVTFNQNVDFESVTFTQNADFSFVTFTQDASFHSATFIKEANFYSATFDKYAKFNPATFTQRANFHSVTFTQQARFEGAEFTQDANFYLATFAQDAVFNFATFGNTVDFQSAKFNKVLGFHKVNVAEDKINTVKLNLNNTTVNRIDYNDTKFTVDNRETFLTLKSVALKQNDQIKALEFHQQEYQTYFKSLSRKQFDKWILGFEYWASAFGTSTTRAIMCLIGITLLFYLLINGFHYDTKAIIDFISPLSHDIDTIFCNIDGWDRWLFFFYKVLQIVLVYEIIKSFRKFSRTL